jgi:glycosyltransferase involved in cell wall biosynthesis
MTRGLMDLLIMWSFIKGLIPEATLHLFVDYACPFYKPEHNIGAMIKQINALYSLGVYKHDRVGQDQLAIEIMKSDIWLHPTQCPETFCITALEMQMGRTLCITSNIGGVKETVNDRGILVDYDGTNNNLFIDVIKELIAGKVNKDALLTKGFNWATQQTWSYIGDKVYELLN